MGVFDLIIKGLCLIGGVLVGSAICNNIGLGPVSLFVQAGIPSEQHIGLGILLLLMAWMMNAVSGGRLHPWDRMDRLSTKKDPQDSSGSIEEEPHPDDSIDSIIAGWYKLAADYSKDHGYIYGHEAALERGELEERWKRMCPGLELPQVLWDDKAGRYVVEGLATVKTGRS